MPGCPAAEVCKGSVARPGTEQQQQSSKTIMSDHLRSRRRRSRPGPARIPHLCHSGHRRGRRGLRRGPLHRLLEPLRARPRRRCAGRGRSEQDRARPDADADLPQEGHVHRASHAGDGRHRWRATTRKPEGSRVRRIPNSRSTRATPRVPRARISWCVEGTCTHLGCLPKSRFEAGHRRSWVPTGRAASSAPAMVRGSTWPGACSTARRPRRTCAFRCTPSASDNTLVIGVDAAKGVA